eukprot:1167282-Prymnesium_polylepis.1
MRATRKDWDGEGASAGCGLDVPVGLEGGGEGHDRGRAHLFEVFALHRHAGDRIDERHRWDGVARGGRVGHAACDDCPAVVVLKACGHAHTAREAMA